MKKYFNLLFISLVLISCETKVEAEKFAGKWLMEGDRFGLGYSAGDQKDADFVMKFMNAYSDKNAELMVEMSADTVKFHPADLSGVFELFVFSDVFETNREILIEGNSVMITLVKNYQDENKIQKKINIRKIIAMKEVIDKPIDEVKIEVKNIDDITKINKFCLEPGNTKVIIDVEADKKRMSFQLSEKRKIDHKMLNLMRNEENIDVL